MVLLEFQYWTDLVMWGIIITAINSTILVVLAIKIFKKSSHSDDDPDGKIKQKIFDTIVKIKEDLQNTV